MKQSERLERNLALLAVPAILAILLPGLMTAWDNRETVQASGGQTAAWEEGPLPAGEGWTMEGMTVDWMGM